jgi:predicted lipid carrier protein YhbT
MEARLPAFVRHLSPAFAGLPLGPALTRSLRALARRRPGLFDRLGAFATERFFIDPVDLGFAFIVVPDGERSTVQATGKEASSDCSVVIRGPILTLLALLDGTQDGDALFFNRVIAISGRTEAVLALRNAIEDAELTPADLIGLSGAFGRLADAGILGSLDMARRFAAAAAPMPEMAERRS